MKINVTVVGRDGDEQEHSVDAGTRASALVDVSGTDSVLLQGNAILRGQDPELREGDELEVVRKSHKAAK